MNTFGQRLKTLIKTSEYKTVVSFSEKAGMHKGSVSNIIRGINNPSYDVILTCANLFSDTEIMWLLTGRDFNNEIALEKKQLEERANFFERKYKRAKSELEQWVKLYSDWMNSQKLELPSGLPIRLPA